MHDWTLYRIELDWDAGVVRIELQSASAQETILAFDLHDLHIPRARPWGPSASINEVVGPTTRPDGLVRLLIEMQSGDELKLVAGRIQMPLTKQISN